VLSTADGCSSCSHLPYVTNYSIDDLKPCMHRMLALQHEAYNTTNVNSVFLPGDAALNPTSDC
jgi:hypothetical protein